MTETTTPQTPSPNTSTNNSQVTVGKPETPQSIFVAMALDMSWRLAAAVLVPIIGGYELDSRLGTTPFITVTGFVVAIAGAALVMRRTSQVAGRMPVPKASTIAPTTDKQEKQS